MLLLMACNTASNKNKVAHKKVIKPAVVGDKVAPIIKQLLTERVLKPFPTQPRLEKEAMPLLDSFYVARSYSAAWFEGAKPTHNAKALLALFNQSFEYGLDTERYETGAFAALIGDSAPKVLPDTLIAACDVALTHYAMLFTANLSSGMLDSASVDYKFKPSKLRVDLPDYLSEAIENNAVTDSILALQPPYKEYRLLQQGLAKFVRNRVLTDDSIAIPDYKRDSAGCYAKVRDVLVARHYLDTTSAQNDSLLREAIKQFQESRGLEADGKPGKNTRAALGQSNLELYLQAAASMERWRWETTLDSDRTWVNLPAYHLKIVQHDSVYRIHKVIVGKPATPSPELSSRISYFIVNPYWFVPYSIASNEILPHIKEDPTYLQKKHYRLFDNKNKEIDPATVDWKKITAKNFPYTVRRDAGDFNDLGLIKFMFPNPYSVYLHDTPSRNLFTSDARGLSHGCIRLENPFEFANYLLIRDSQNVKIDTIAKLVVNKEQRTISLKKPMAIYIRYFTTEGGADGQLYFYQDIYGRDEPIREKMLKSRQQLAL